MNCGVGRREFVLDIMLAFCEHGDLNVISSTTIKRYAALHADAAEELFLVEQGSQPRRLAERSRGSPALSGCRPVQVAVDFQYASQLLSTDCESGLSCEVAHDQRIPQPQRIRTWRMETVGTLVLDNKKYARVLAKLLPRIITSNQEHARLLAEVENLMDKGEHRTAEEDAALELMVRLIQNYEEEHHPLPNPSPEEMLVYLMERRGLRQADLLPIFKSRGYISDVINGKRAISKVHARQLAGFFKVSADLFI
jgi:HTH-type transcriptional regulator/antitoxin HigA